MKKGKLILIVDDNAENRAVLGTLLMDQGYEVGISCDGFEALEFLRHELPDLILLDIMMPGMNGFDVCQKIKEDKSRQHIPIIFLSAKGNTEDIVKGFKVGGKDYVQKPFNREELLARIETHIELHTLKGLLPICAQCKKIQDDGGKWENIETYISKHSETNFSHSLCPNCMHDLYGDEDWFKEE